jgi:hypothetical protein
MTKKNWKTTACERESHGLLYEKDAAVTRIKETIGKEGSVQKPPPTGVDSSVNSLKSNFREVKGYPSARMSHGGVRRIIV